MPQTALIPLIGACGVVVGAIVTGMFAYLGRREPSVERVAVLEAQVADLRRLLDSVREEADNYRLLAHTTRERNEELLRENERLAEENAALRGGMA
jgi:hypothetical protein